MPGLDGLETLEEIRKINPQIPVVMITKNEEEHLMAEAIGKEISDYLTKPVNPSQILLVLKKLLESKNIKKNLAGKNFSKLFKDISDRLETPLSSSDWYDIYLQLTLFEIEMSQIINDEIKESFLGLIETCNEYFGHFIEENYLSWLEGQKEPVLSNKVFSTFVSPFIKKGQKVIMMLIDCLRLDQWYAISEILSEYFNIEQHHYYSILPTSTAYSRNSLFSGLLPIDIYSRYPQYWEVLKDERSVNKYEKELLREQCLRLGLDKAQENIFYLKIINEEKVEGLIKHYEKNIHKYQLSAFVYNFVDLLSHNRSHSDLLREISTDESAFRSVTVSWFQHSGMYSLLKHLSETKDLCIVVTTDHGSILARKPSKIIASWNATSGLRYKFGHALETKAKEALVIKNLTQWKLPKEEDKPECILAKSDYYLTYNIGFKNFIENYKPSFIHGGISLQEMILPIAVLTSKKQNA